MQDTSKINWQMILLSLRRDYAPLAKIAREVGCSSKSLQRVARYGCVDMFYSNGSKIMALYNEHCNVD
jgi:hypothetical protein